jgi:hypothetical protein
MGAPRLTGRAAAQVPGELALVQRRTSGGGHCLLQELELIRARLQRTKVRVSRNRA